MEALVSAAFKATPSIESAASPQQKWSQTKASLALKIIIIIIAVDVEVGVNDTPVFLLNEYIVELNPANFNILNQILN